MVQQESNLDPVTGKPIKTKPQNANQNNPPDPPEGAETDFAARIKQLLLEYGPELLAMLGFGYLVATDDDAEPPEHPPEGSQICMRVNKNWSNPSVPIPQATQIGAASFQINKASDTTNRTTLNPLPNDGHEWFRTAAGECRKWTVEEREIIRAALKKRKQMKEAYIRKYGCKTPKRHCKKYRYPSRRYCSC